VVVRFSPSSNQQVKGGSARALVGLGEGDTAGGPGIGSSRGVSWRERLRGENDIAKVRGGASVSRVLQLTESFVDSRAQVKIFREGRIAWITYSCAVWIQIGTKFTLSVPRGIVELKYSLL
jgi:hypothetical protein